MNKQYRNFLLLVALLMAIDVGFLLFMMKFTDIAQNKHFVAVVAVVLLLVIPGNIYAAWKMKG